MSKKELRKLAQAWREYADGHYCQTYNKGMADGLRKAADELEAALKKSAQQSLHLTAFGAGGLGVNSLQGKSPAEVSAATHGGR